LIATDDLPCMQALTTARAQSPQGQGEESRLEQQRQLRAARSRAKRTAAIMQHAHAAVAQLSRMLHTAKGLRGAAPLAGAVSGTEGKGTGVWRKGGRQQHASDLALGLMILHPPSVPPPTGLLKAGDLSGETTAVLDSRADLMLPETSPSPGKVKAKRSAESAVQQAFGTPGTTPAKEGSTPTTAQMALKGARHGARPGAVPGALEAERSQDHLTVEALEESLELLRELIGKAALPAHRTALPANATATATVAEAEAAEEEEEAAVAAVAAAVAAAALSNAADEAAGSSEAAEGSARPADADGEEAEGGLAVVTEPPVPSTAPDERSPFSPGAPSPVMTGEEYRMSLVAALKGRGLVARDGMESAEALAPLLMAAGASAKEFKVPGDEDDEEEGDEGEEGDEEGAADDPLNQVLDREALKKRAMKIFISKGAKGKETKRKKKR